eukprot:Skav205011  [mRNA]  locus=scaffold2134:89208:95808:- [translate_table: standard]
MRPSRGPKADVNIQDVDMERDPRYVSKEQDGEALARTNAELGKMVEDLTGRRPPPRTSKATLVNRIERASLGNARKSSTAQLSEKAPKRGCRATISKGQLAQMRSVLKSDVASLALRHTHKDLEKMWNRMGMTSMYPKMTGDLALKLEKMWKSLLLTLWVVYGSETLRLEEVLSSGKMGSALMWTMVSCFVLPGAANPVSIVALSTGLCIEDLKNSSVGGRPCAALSSVQGQRWQFVQNGPVISTVDGKCLVHSSKGQAYMDDCGKWSYANQRWTWVISDHDLLLRSYDFPKNCLQVFDAHLNVSVCDPQNRDQHFLVSQTSAVELWQANQPCKESSETPWLAKQTAEELKRVKELHIDVTRKLLTELPFQAEEVGRSVQDLLESIAANASESLKELRSDAKEIARSVIEEVLAGNTSKLLKELSPQCQEPLGSVNEDPKLLQTIANETLMSVKEFHSDATEKLRSVIKEVVAANTMLEKVQGQEPLGSVYEDPKLCQTIANETLMLLKEFHSETQRRLKEDAQKLLQETPVALGLCTMSVFVAVLIGVVISAMRKLNSLQRPSDSMKAKDQEQDRLYKQIEKIADKLDQVAAAVDENSWTDVMPQQSSRQSESCCFLQDTYLTKVTDGGQQEDVPAQKLFEGARVLAADGTEIQVLRPPEQHQVDAVIELRAGESRLVVSPDHRILVPGARNKTVQAKDLEVGSEVNLDGSVAKLTSSERKDEPTIVLKISFKPDLPVAAFMRSPAILSKGSREKPNIRRAARKPGQGQESETIPDTEPPLTP